MPHVLQEVTGDAVIDRARLGPGPLLVGSGERADVVLEGSGVSVRHARFGFDAVGPWVRDLGSSEGTRINGSPSDGRTALGPDDLVGIGGHLLRVRCPDDATSDPGPALRDALAVLPDELAKRLRAEAMADRWEADAWRAVVVDPGRWIDRIDNHDDLVAAVEAQLQSWGLTPPRGFRHDPARLLGRLAEDRDPAMARRVRALQRWVAPLLSRAAPVRDLRSATTRYQLDQLQRALDATRGNRARAAERLGVSRQFVYRLLDRERPASDDDEGAPG